MINGTLHIYVHLNKKKKEVSSCQSVESLAKACHKTIITVPLVLILLNFKMLAIQSEKYIVVQA